MGRNLSKNNQPPLKSMQHTNSCRCMCLCITTNVQPCVEKQTVTVFDAQCYRIVIEAVCVLCRCVGQVLFNKYCLGMCVMLRSPPTTYDILSPLCVFSSVCVRTPFRWLFTALSSPLCIRDQSLASFSHHYRTQAAGRGESGALHYVCFCFYHS